MPAWAATITSLTLNDLAEWNVGEVTVARLQFAVAQEERDGVDFLIRRVDRMTERGTGEGRRATGDGRRATGDGRL